MNLRFGRLKRGKSLEDIDNFIEAMNTFSHEINQINLFNQNLDDEKAIRIIEALSLTPDLKSIHFSKNQVGDLTAAALAKEILQNQSLIRVYLWDNQIGEEGLSQIYDSIMQNALIRIIDLSGNPGWEVWEARFAAAMSPKGVKEREEIRSFGTNFKPAKRD